MGCLKLRVGHDVVSRVNACLVLLFLHSDCSMGVHVCYFGGRQGRRVDSRCYVMYDLLLSFPQAVKFCKGRNGLLTQVLDRQLDLALTNAWRTRITAFNPRGVWLGGAWYDGANGENSRRRKPIHHDVTGGGDTTGSDGRDHAGLGSYTAAHGGMKIAGSRGGNSSPDGRSEGIWAWLDGGPFQYQNWVESGRVLLPANTRCVTKLLRPPYSWRPTKCQTPSYVCCQYPACPPGHFGVDGCRRTCIKCGAQACDILTGECVRRDHPVFSHRPTVNTHEEFTPHYPMTSHKHPTPTRDPLKVAHHRLYLVKGLSQTWMRRNEQRQARTNTSDTMVASRSLGTNESRAKRSEFCPHGFFGPSCKKRCNCFREKPCEQELGTCPLGRCTVGWIPPQCSESQCNPGTYGMNCSSKCDCGRSSSGQVRKCHPVSGNCDNKGCSSIDNTTKPICMLQSCPIRGRYANCTKACNCWGSLICHPHTGNCPYLACRAYLNEAAPNCTPETRDATLSSYLSLSALAILVSFKVSMDITFSNWRVKKEGGSRHAAT